MSVVAHLAGQRPRLSFLLAAVLTFATTMLSGVANAVARVGRDDVDGREPDRRLVVGGVVFPELASRPQPLT